MCIQTDLYTCTHTNSQPTPCRFPPPPKSSGFRSLFCLSPRPTSKCRKPSGIKHIYTHCPSCSISSKSSSKGREVHNALQKELLQERRHEQRREAFRCQACIREGRRRVPGGNGGNKGLCCERGIKEFYRKEREKEYTPPRPEIREMLKRQKGNETVYQTPLPPSVPAKDISKGRTNAKTAPRRSSREEMEKARLAASQAARQYGWAQQPRTKSPTHHDSRYMEPALIKGYLSTSGSDPRILGQGLGLNDCAYVQPGVQWNRWGNMVQGNHGMLPPPPNRPLPVLPLKGKGGKTAKKGVERKPLPVQKGHGEGTMSMLDGELEAAIAEWSGGNTDDRLNSDPTWRDVRWR